MIAGLEDISAAEIGLEGRGINDAAAKSRDLAMLFHNYVALPAHDARECGPSR